MYTITLRINTDEDIQGIKESIAMDMEKYGDIEVVDVREDLASRAKTDGKNINPEDFEVVPKGIREGFVSINPGSSKFPFYLRYYGGEQKTTGLKTLDMMNAAQRDNCTYIVDDLAYNAKQGFHDYAWGDSWEGSAFPLINDIMELEWSKMED